MASKNVLQEAISKLHYNTKLLQEKMKTCSTKEQKNEIERQIKQNESMMLDYQYRIAHQIES